MLHGPLLSRMLLFALPLIASGILQQSFNSVDVAVVGRFTGSHALAAVGSVGPVIGLLINLFIGISVGVNVVIANYIGQGNREGVRRAVGATMVLAGICGAAALVIGESFAHRVLDIMGTPPEVVDDATAYMRIFLLGLPLMLLYNFGSAILRSVGDTRRPFYALVAGGIVNVCLNLLFVVGFGMGVNGVAWATVISNGVNAAIIVVILMRETGDIRLVIRDIRPNVTQMWKISAIGIPAGLQGAVFALSNTLILSAINSFGATATAGSAAAINYEFYCYFICSAFAQTAVAFISQNYGAGQMDRIRRIFRLSLLLATVGTLIPNVLIAWKSHFFLTAFTTDESVIAIGTVRILCVLVFQWIASYYEVAGSAMRGLGFSMTPTVIVITGTCMLRLVWVLVFPLFGGEFWQLMLVYPASWLLTDVMMWIAYRRIWRKVTTRVSAASGSSSAAGIA